MTGVIVHHGLILARHVLLRILLLLLWLLWLLWQMRMLLLLLLLFRVMYLLLVHFQLQLLGFESLDLRLQSVKRRVQLFYVVLILAARWR